MDFNTIILTKITQIKKKPIADSQSLPTKQTKIRLHHKSDFLLQLLQL